MKKQVHFFGESVFYLPDEKEQAEQYLRSWKLFLTRKLSRDTYNLKCIDEMWVHRDATIVSALATTASMALKLAFEIEFKFETDPFLGTGN